MKGRSEAGAPAEAHNGLTLCGELDGRAIYANRPASEVSEAAEMLARALLRRYGGEDGLREAIRSRMSGEVIT